MNRDGSMARLRSAASRGSTTLRLRPSTTSSPIPPVEYEAAENPIWPFEFEYRPEIIGGPFQWTPKRCWTKRAPPMKRWMSAVRSNPGGGVDAAASKKHRFDGFVALGLHPQGDHDPREVIAYACLPISTAWRAKSHIAIGNGIPDREHRAQAEERADPKRQNGAARPPAPRWRWWS